MPITMSMKSAGAPFAPVRTSRMQGYFDSMAFRAALKDLKDLLAYNLQRSEYEVRNFIDGRRSILDIRNGVSENAVEILDAKRGLLGIIFWLRPKK